MGQNTSIEYDEEADVLYVRLAASAPVRRTVAIDDSRLIDYSEDGVVLGLEFIDASQGIDLRDLPFGPTAEQLIGDAGLDFPILTS